MRNILSRVRKGEKPKIAPSNLPPGKQRLVKAIVTVGGIGNAPVASGTWGTLPGVLVCWLLAPWNVWGPELALYVFAIVAVYALGEYASSLAEGIYQRKDDGHIVIDEVLGYMVTMLLIPSNSWPWLVAGFFAFRLFDIAKPPPSNRLQSLPGGRGVMIDDAIAGVYACAVMHAAYWTGRAMGWW